jgi:hypothetical protein
VFALFELAGDGEIANASGDLALVQVRLDSRRAIDVDALALEIIADLDVLERHRRQALRKGG